MTTQSDQKNPVHSPRKGAKTGVVSELSVFLKVKPGHEKQIREVFTRRAATSDWHVQATRVLASVGTIHEARQQVSPELVLPEKVSRRRTSQVTGQLLLGGVKRRNEWGQYGDDRGGDDYQKGNQRYPVSR